MKKVNIFQELRKERAENPKKHISMKTLKTKQREETGTKESEKKKEVKTKK